MRVFHRNVWRVGLLCTVILLFHSARSFSAEGWPQWRGPNRNGVVTEFSAPQNWPETLDLKWKVSVGSGHASPIVVEERVYIHARQDGEEVVSCLELETGERLWRKSYPVSYTANPAATSHGKGPKSTPVWSDNKLFTLGISGILSCFDARTGDVKWRKEFSDKFPRTSPLYGTAMSPLVESGLLIAHVGGPDQGSLIALDIETGDLSWSWDGDGPGYTSPIIVQIEGTKQVVTQTQNYCVGLSATTGELLWSIPFTTPYDQNIVTPVVYEQNLIFSGTKKGTMAIRVTKQADGWATEQIWHNPKLSMYMSSPVISDGLLFGLSRQRGGQFFCLDPRTGSTLWTSDGRQGDNAAILTAGEMLFFLTTNAELLVARRNAKELELVAQYTVAESPTWAHPAILNQRFLIKDASTLALWSVK